MGVSQAVLLLCVCTCARRAVQPALVPEDAAMPRLDFVLLSHNHYDHLDSGSVDRLFRWVGQEHPHCIAADDS
jgi:L-ascorbate metabolism protein UlaG (beta-lactamase superfamily)